MKITNHAHLPDSIVQAVINDPYPHGKIGDISVTRLIGPPQIRILERRHQDEIEEDAADRIWSLVGQIGHGILERAETVAITEERLFTKVEGWRVSGQFDRLVLLPDGTLQDYKFTSVWACMDGVKPEWEAQLNLLRYLVEVNGYPPIRRLQIVAILRDWSKGKARAGGDYPRVQVTVLDVSVWSMAEAGRYITERVRLHQAAEAGHIPPCTADERWERPTTYAVKKPGRKSAVRVYGSMEQAQSLVSQTPSGYVEIRMGESIRCADYCAVRDFCPQWAAMHDQMKESA